MNFNNVKRFITIDHLKIVRRNKICVNKLKHFIVLFLKWKFEEDLDVEKVVFEEYYFEGERIIFVSLYVLGLASKSLDVFVKKLISICEKD